MRIEFEVTDEIVSDIVCGAIAEQIPYVEDPVNAMALIRTYQYFCAIQDWPALWDVCEPPDCLYDEYEELKDLLGK